MTLRYQQYGSLKQTREFLGELLRHAGEMKTSEIRGKASECLKHFPCMDAQGQPFWSMDELTVDRGTPHEKA